MGVARKADLWPPGSTLRVAFLDGDVASQDLVFNAILTWEKYARIYFLRTDPADAQIRVALTQRKFKTFEATQALSPYLAGRPTSYIYCPSPAAFDLPGTLHEAGRMCGFNSENLNPLAPTSYDRPKLYAWALATYGWDQATVDYYLLGQLAATDCIYTEFDPASLMAIGVPDSVCQGFTLPGGAVISPHDAELARRCYPMPGTKVKNWFNDLLGRDPSPEDVDYYDPMPPEQALAIIMGGDEYTERLYRQLLHREPFPSDLDFWRGRPPGRLQLGILTSAEYAGRQP